MLQSVAQILGLGLIMQAQTTFAQSVIVQRVITFGNCFGKCWNVLARAWTRMIESKSYPGIGELVIQYQEIQLRFPSWRHASGLAAWQMSHCESQGLDATNEAFGVVIEASVSRSPSQAKAASLEQTFRVDGPWPLSCTVDLPCMRSLLGGGHGAR